MTKRFILISLYQTFTYLLKAIQLREEIPKECLQKKIDTKSLINFKEAKTQFHMCDVIVSS